MRHLLGTLVRVAATRRDGVLLRRPSMKEVVTINDKAILVGVDIPCELKGHMVGRKLRKHAGLTCKSCVHTHRRAMLLYHSMPYTAMGMTMPHVMMRRFCQGQGHRGEQGVKAATLIVTGDPHPCSWNCPQLQSHASATVVRAVPSVCWAPPVRCPPMRIARLSSYRIPTMRAIGI